MAVSVARTDPIALGTLAGARARVAVLPWLALIVVVSTCARIAAGWLRATPLYLPDEYLYAELGRSLSESMRPLVRGVEASFPALLQPLLTAPFWLVDDVEHAFRLVQAFGALAMSLAAPAAFVLARRVGIERGHALGVAAVAVAIPDLLYAGWLLAEPFAYPLVIAAVAAGVAALERPSRRTQLAFVALAALAVLARAQFVALPVCFVLALVVVGVRERRLRAALREQALLLTIFALPVVAALAVGRERVFGIYSAPFGGKGAEVLALSSWSGPNALVLLYVCGFALVPGALLGVVYAVARPRSRAELAFAALTVTLTAALLAETAVFGAVHVVQERYVFYVVPLLAAAFALYARRGWPARRAHALVAAILLLVALRWPLAEFSAANGKEHSPTLLALNRLEALLGNAGTASLIVASLAVLLCLLAAAAPWRPRLGVAAAFGAAVAAGVAASVGAVMWDVGNGARVAEMQLGPNPSWVDDSGLRDVVLLRNFDAQRVDSIQLFWNRSVDTVGLMQGAERLDPFASERVSVNEDGSLVLGERPLRSPLLVDDYAVTATFTGAERVARSPIHSLWRPTGVPRLSLYMIGRFHDGWLRGGGGINLWPQPGRRELEGTLTMRVRAPAKLESMKIDFALPSGRTHSVDLVPGRWQHVRIPVCSDGPWQAEFHASERGSFESRIVSARSTVPVFRPDASVCAQPAT